MLKEVFRTVPVVYRTESDLKRHNTPSGTWIYPYVESFKLFGPQSLVTTTFGTKYGPTTIMMTGWMGYKYYGYADIFGWRYDGTTGKLIHKFHLFGNTDSKVTGPDAPVSEGIFYMRYSTVARSGRFWATDFSSGTIRPYRFGNVATALEDEMPDPGEPMYIYDMDNIVHYTQFEGSPFFGYSFAIDDLTPEEGIFLNPGPTQKNPGGGVYGVGVYSWTTGKYHYDIETPAQVVDIALEDRDRAYVLLANRVLLLLDYVRGEILGAAKVPPLQMGSPIGGGSGLDQIFDDVRISWDRTFKRLLIVEKTPDNPDGSCSVCIRGFRAVPEPVRITPPIPLKVPRQRRVVPVLVQVLGDMNEGVGGYVVDAQVSGSGSLVGIPITDHHGNGIIQVACEGSRLFSPASPTYPFEWDYTGSPDADPPHTGLVQVTASVKVYQPDPADIKLSGAVGEPLPAGGGGEQPGPPGGGSTGSLPETAPNMQYILEQVFNSRVWNLDEGNEYDQVMPDGRGAFTEVAVRAMHDVDARFGHIKKFGTQNQYNGHAVDAVNFLNDDGVTGETFDILGPPVKWQFQFRLAVNVELWKYPA